jgi:hypothetical protein
VPVVLPLLVHAAVLPPPAAPAAPRRGCTTFALVCFNIVHRVCAGAMPRATATAVVSGAARVSWAAAFAVHTTAPPLHPTCRAERRRRRHILHLVSFGLLLVPAAGAPPSATAAAAIAVAAGALCRCAAGAGGPYAAAIGSHSRLAASTTRPLLIVSPGMLPSASVPTPARATTARRAASIARPRCSLLPVALHASSIMLSALMQSDITKHARSGASFALVTVVRNANATAMSSASTTS